MDPIIVKAKEYISWDINLETRSHIEALVDADDKPALKKLLNSRLAFGTAGLRGPMGPGYCAMNELVILQTCQGVIAHLETCFDASKSREMGVAIGYDHRRLGTISSLSIARTAAAVFLERGYKVWLLEGFVPTPFVPFAVVKLGAVAGIMVTASHNPKQDDGFKLYWANGCQIIPPHDSSISECITQNLAPWVKYDLEDVSNHPNAVDKTEEIADSYFSAIKRLALTAVPSSTLKITYTAMHGVGSKWLTRAFGSYGLTIPLLVEEQCEPDPDFPTVKFPNPEEKGALDLALKTGYELLVVTSIGLIDLNGAAESAGSKLVLANDPDADRLAMAEYNDSTGKWHVFSGNEIGTILGHYQISQWKRRKELGQPTRSQAAVLASVVSSRMLRAIALTECVIYADTLTGFKWIGNKSVELQSGANGSEPVDVVFSYEEALGYCVGDIIADKDGISAAVVAAELAHGLYDGKYEPVRSVYAYLQAIYQRYGRFASYNSYYFSHQSETTEKIFHDLRHSDESDRSRLQHGRSYADVAVVSVKDVTLGYDSVAADNESDLPRTPDSHMIMYEFANGCSLTLRTSGTEPKIKFYSELRGKADEDNLPQLKRFVDSALEEMLRPAYHGIVRP